MKNKLLAYDVVFVVLLIALFDVLYFRVAQYMTIAPDGLLQTFSAMIGDLRAFNIIEIKEPGRPFVGLPFKFSDFLLGGSVTEINSLQFSFYFLSACFVYVFVRIILPDQPVWAASAGLLKSCLAMTIAIFDDSSLVIYFVEAMLLLAATLLAHSKKLLSSVAFITIWVCLTITCGSYQSIWPLAAAIPVGLLGSGFLPWKSRRVRLALIAWYGGMTPIVLFCVWSSYRFAAAMSDPLSVVLARALRGAWDAVSLGLFNAIFGFVSMPGVPRVIPSPVSGARDIVMALLIAALVVAWVASRPFRRGRLWSVEARLPLLGIALGSALIVGPLLRPSLHFEPIYGARFLALTVVGVILTLISLGKLMEVAAGTAGVLLWTAAVASICWFSCVQVSGLSAAVAAQGFPARRFLEDLTAEAPRVKEGTIAVFEEVPNGAGPLHDAFDTRHFRIISDTFATFLVDEHAAVRASDGWHVTTTMDLNPAPSYTGRPRQVYPSPDGIGAPVVAVPYFDREPQRFSDLKTYTIPFDRVVVFRWDWNKRRLWIDHDRSAPDRVFADVPSMFGQKLFPAQEIAAHRLAAENHTGP